MTDWPCPLCEQMIHQKDCPRRNTRPDPPSLPNDAAKVRETPEAFVSERPCPMIDCPCGCGGKIRPEAEASVRAQLANRANPGFDYHEPPSAIDNAPQGAREGDGELVFPPNELAGRLECHPVGTLAAKDAEIERLKGDIEFVKEMAEGQRSEDEAELMKLREAIKGAHVLSNHATRMINTRDTLIRQLTDALRDLAALYDTDEGCRSLPEYRGAQEAIAAAERHEKGG